MQILKIHKLGPIEDCELQINDIMILTGQQASGKSTIAKSIFFFKNIRKLLELQMKKILLPGNDKKITLKNRLIKAIRINFLQIFGSSWCMDGEMELEYSYSSDISVKVSLTDDETNSNYIWIGFSKALTEKLNRLNETYVDDVFSDEVFSTKDVHKTVCEIFSDTMDVISLVQKEENKVLMTTHSPYVLGTINNLLYATDAAKMADAAKVDDIIDKKYWIQYEALSGYYVENGKLFNCMDDEYRQIRHEVIDGASRDINNAYDALVEIKYKERAK